MVQDTGPVGSHGHHRGQGRRWHGLPGVIDAPCYFPTVEEFEEPLKFIASIRQEAERYGICRICPPSGWKPPFVHKPDKLRFATKEQDLGKLAGTQRLTRKFTENLRKFLFLIGKPMESAFGGKVCIGDHGVPVDMFRLFKEVRGMGGHSEVTRKQGWDEISEVVGLQGSGKGVEQAYLRYLSDFEAVHSGRGLESHKHTPVVYREKASVEADLRVGITLWHFLEEDHGAGRCYYGTVKSLRSSQCIVEYNRAERLPEPEAHRRDGANERQQHDGNGSRGRGGWGDNARSDDGSWAVSHYASEQVQPFRVTLPRAQLSTLVLNGRSPAAAKLAAHGVICEVCSIAAASKAVLAVCASCDSAYHLGCVEPSLPRVPLNDWFCGDCAKDGSTAEGLALAAGAGLFSVPPSLSSNGSKSNPTGGSKKGSSSRSISAGAGGDGGEQGGVIDGVGVGASYRCVGRGNTRGTSSRVEGSKSERTEVGAKGGPSGAASGGPEKKTRRSSAPAAMETIATTRGRRSTKPRVSLKEASGSDVDADVEDDKAGEGDSDERLDSESDGEDEEAMGRQGVRKSRCGKGARGSSSGARDGDAGAADGEPGSRMRGVSGMGGRSLKFGFGNGGHFTLKEFALMADGWRSSYLARRGLGDEASEAEMEEEFWKLVGPDPPEDDVKVLYGSDLDTGAVGSGFPWTRGGVGMGGTVYDQNGSSRRAKCADVEESQEHDLGQAKNPYALRNYEEDAWNLNCLPTSDGSLLQFLGTQIQGVMVPWLYVGMAFSAFCWHNEDHYLYSINYLHAGSPKRWYGVPGAEAGDFEAAVKRMFPELFDAHPDLLMQLVTMAHPSKVAEQGVMVSSTTQREGEFVLTFPQAYHAGFNMGTNCAEAVNFAPPDWLPWGKSAQDHYRLHKRKPVFSHEGLVLSLVDLFAKQKGEGFDDSSNLYRYLRDELEVLAAIQEDGIEAAKRMGCTRFERIEKLAERLRGWGHVSSEGSSLPAAGGVGMGASSGCAGTISAAGSGRRSCNSSNNNECYTGHAAGGSSGSSDGVLSGLETASPVQGPQCSICYQYCFLELAICDSCNSAGRAPGRSSSNGAAGGFGGSVGGYGDHGYGGAALGTGRRRPARRRRFACSRHLAELCPCPASEYTYYIRKDPGELFAAARGLSSLKEQLEAWRKETRCVLGMALGRRRSGPSGERKGGGASSASGGGSGSGGAGGGGGAAVKNERLAEESVSVAAVQGSSVKLEGCCAQKTTGDRLEANGGAEFGGDLCASTPPATASQMPSAPTTGSHKEEATQRQWSNASACSISARWHARPALSHVDELVKIGSTLGGRADFLAELRAVVDSCAEWTRATDKMVGWNSHSSAPASPRAPSNTPVATVSTGRRRGESSRGASLPGSAGEPSANGVVAEGEGRDGGARAGALGSTKGRQPEQHEAVGFSAAVAHLEGEGVLPARPVQRTDMLCAALVNACQLRQQVRSLLGLGDDQEVQNCVARCQALRDAEREAEELERKKFRSRSSASRWTIDSLSAAPRPDGDNAPIMKCYLGTGDDERRVGKVADVVDTCGVQTEQGGAVEAPPGMPSSIGDASNSGAARTRTRTNVSLPTGMLAAERGSWKGLPWRLWPVHQANGTALLEACSASVVEVPEIAPLRQALDALSRRGRNGLSRQESSAVPASASGPGVVQSGVTCSANAGGGKKGGVGAVAGRGRRAYDKIEVGGKKGSPLASGGSGVGRGRGATSADVQGPRARLSCSPPPSSPKGMVSAGAVLVGAAHKRRRQDAVAASSL